MKWIYKIWKKNKITLNKAENVKIRLSVVQNCYVQRYQIKLLEYVLNKKRREIVDNVCTWQISPFMPLHPDGWTITRRDNYVVEFTICNNTRFYEFIETLKLCQETLKPAKTQLVFHLFRKRVRVRRTFAIYLCFLVLNTKIYTYLNDIYKKTVKKFALRTSTRKRNKLFPPEKEIFIFKQHHATQEEFKYNFITREKIEMIKRATECVKIFNQVPNYLCYSETIYVKYSNNKQVILLEMIIYDPELQILSRKRKVFKNLSKKKALRVFRLCPLFFKHNYRQKRFLLICIYNYQMKKLLE